VSLSGRGGALLRGRDPDPGLGGGARRGRSLRARPRQRRAPVGAVAEAARAV